MGRAKVQIRATGAINVCGISYVVVAIFDLDACKYVPLYVFRVP